jgi:lipopolysaccharide export system ATP-binding protein
MDGNSKSEMTVTDTDVQATLAVEDTYGLMVSGLKKTFKGRPVVRDVSLRLRSGEVLGLLGPNGAGKTTSFYMIMGLIKADAGKVFLDGADLTNLPMYRRARAGIGYLPQEASIFRTMTVAENIMAILEVVENEAAVREQRCDALLAEFAISHLRDVKGAMLSGGERRRAEIARALASEPKILLLDEPFAGIDPIVVNEIRVLIGQLKARGIGVLITDHNVRETLGIVDRAVIMHDGGILIEGSPDDIVKDENVRRHYLGASFAL